MIRITCSGCGKTYQVQDQFAGQTTKCPGCGTAIHIAAADPAAPIVSQATPASPFPAGQAPEFAPSGGTSGLAIGALVCSILGFCCLPVGIVGLVLGFISLGQIDRSRSTAGARPLNGRGLAVSAIIIGAIAVILSIALFLVGMLLPALGAARRTARQMQNSTQLRGIHSGLVLFSQGNSDFYPGYDGKRFVRVDGNGEANTGEFVEGRYRILLDNNYFTPEYMVSPVENKPLWRQGPVTSDNYSYAMPDLSSNNGTFGRGKSTQEWTATTNTMAAVLSDRSKSIDPSLSTISVHVVTVSEDSEFWRGGVAWNDNHVTFETDGFLQTKYGSSLVTQANDGRGDDLFRADRDDEGQPDNDALMIFSGQ